jgi:hypothetical protein
MAELNRDAMTVSTARRGREPYSQDVFRSGELVKDEGHGRFDICGDDLL